MAASNDACRRRCDPHYDQTRQAGQRDGQLYGRVLVRDRPQVPRAALVERVYRVRPGRGLRRRYVVLCYAPLDSDLDTLRDKAKRIADRVEVY